MKRALTLIPTLGSFTIFTTAILVSAPKSASAYCVHNLTGEVIASSDLSTRIQKLLAPDEKYCCSGKNQECGKAEVKVKGEGKNGTGECTVSTPPHALLEVRYKDRRMVCNVRKQFWAKRTRFMALHIEQMIHFKADTW